MSYQKISPPSWLLERRDGDSTVHPFNLTAVLTQHYLSAKCAPPASKKVVLHTPKKSTDVRQLYFMVDAELDKAGVRQEVRDMAIKLADFAACR
jgi:hypothetical protein